MTTRLFLKSMQKIAKKHIKNLTPYERKAIKDGLKNNDTKNV